MKLILDSISKSYKDTPALKNISLSLTPGIYGLLGANGSGKTTLMNIISQNLPADRGKVLTDPPQDLLKDLGYMPQQQALYPDMSARSFLFYMANLKQVTQAQAQIEVLLKAVNLDAVAHKPMKTFSGGMKQRVLLAQALLGNPKVLLLDEPTAGLDPVERIRIRNLISSFSSDKIILIATHVVSDIEFIAKEIILLKKGELIGSHNILTWLSSIQGKVYEIKVDDSTLEDLKVHYVVGNIYHSVDGVTARIIADKLPSVDSRPVEPVLEDLYLYYNQEDFLSENAKAQAQETGAKV